MRPEYLRLKNRISVSGFLNPLAFDAFFFKPVKSCF